MLWFAYVMFISSPPKPVLKYFSTALDDEASEEDSTSLTYWLSTFSELSLPYTFSFLAGVQGLHREFKNTGNRNGTRSSTSSGEAPGTL